MSIGSIIILILILAFVGVLPRWNYSRDLGWGPSGIVGMLLVVLVILLILGRI